MSEDDGSMQYITAMLMNGQEGKYTGYGEHL